MSFGEYVLSPRIYVSIFDKKAKDANEVKMCKRYERCETVQTKIQLKTKRYKQNKLIFQQYMQNYKTLVF